MKLSVGSKWTKRALPLVMLALAVGLVFLNTERPHIATAQGGGDHRYIILIEGLTSTGDCPSPKRPEPDRWRSVIKDTLAVQDDKILSVSYAGPEGYCAGDSAPFRFPQYTALDTCEGIDKAVASLGHVVNSVSAKDKDARFDIIGHSLGGFVAAYWVASLPSDNVSLTRIHSVMTLDSPLGDVALQVPIRERLQEFFPGCLPSGSDQWAEGTFKILYQVALIMPHNW